MTEHFEEFLRERRERAEQTRRVLVGVLAFACVALAVSNVVLALRLSRARPVVEASRPTAAASVPTVTDTPPSVKLPATRESVPPAAPAAPAEPAPPPAAAPRTEDTVSAPGPDAERAMPGPEAASLPARPPAPPGPAAFPDPTARDEATAAWMLATYGRAEARARARAALHFYDARSAEAAYWRRVLARL